MLVITLKESRLLLRSHRAFGFLMAALVTLGGVFLLNWADMSRRYEAYASIGQRTMLGRQIFSIISIVQLCAMGLIAPLTAATAVSGEREAGTLELLFCTGLSRLSLLLGKWAATVYYEFVLLVCSLPVLALVFLLGGVGADEYLFSALLILAAVLAYGMLGLACSCLFRRSIAALAAALLTVLFLSGGLPLFMVFLQSIHVIDLDMNNSPGLTFFNALFWSVSPLVTWIHRLDIGSSTTTPLFKDPVFTTHLLIQMALFLCALGLARRAFARLGGEGPGKALDQFAATAQRRRWPFLRLLPQLIHAARFVLRPILRPNPQRLRDGLNPIYGRARAVYPWRRLLPMMGAFCIPIALMLGDAWKERDPNDFVLFTVFYAITLVGLFTPIFAATAVARERDEKTMDLLRVTPLSAGAIVRGKFLGALRPLLAIALMAAFVPLLWRGFQRINYPMMYNGRLLDPQFNETRFLVPAARAIILLFVFTAFYAAVSIYISTVQRRGAGAMTLAYIILFVLALPGPFALALITYEFWGRDWGFLELLHFAFKSVAECLSPLISPYYYLAMTNSSVRHAYVFWERPEQANSSAILLFLIHTALVLALAAYALRAAARRLARDSKG